MSAKELYTQEERLLAAISHASVIAGAINITAVVGDSITATVVRDAAIAFSAPTSPTIGYAVSRT